MNGHRLESVDTEKDLGVMVSNDLKVSQQCNQACNKAARMLGMMRRTVSDSHKIIQDIGKTSFGVLLSSLVPVLCEKQSPN